MTGKATLVNCIANLFNSKKRLRSYMQTTEDNKVNPESVIIGKNIRESSHLDNSGERASTGYFVPVSGRTSQKNGYGNENSKSGDSKSPFPPFVVFNPHNKCDCYQTTK